MILDKIKNKIDIKFIALVFVCLMPFICSIIFALPASDDFSMAKDLIPGGITLSEIIGKTNEEYMGWMGLWPFFFLEYLLNPLYVFPGIRHATGIFLEITFIVFIIVLYLYLKTFFKYIFGIDKDKIYKLTYLLFLIAFLNSAIYDEIYYWFVGNVYLWNVLFMMWNQILIIKLFRTEVTKSLYIRLCIVGFIACFAFQLDVFSGCIYLIELFIWKKKNNPIKYQRIIPLVVMIAGGMISAFAPGNFARSKAYSAELSIGNAIINSVSNAIKCFIQAIDNPLYIVLVTIMICIGYVFAKNVQKMSIMVLVIMAMASLLGLTFSVALGYSNSNLPSRIVYMYDLILYVCSVLIAIQLGKIIADIEVINLNTIVAIAVIICASVLYRDFINIDGELKVEQRPWYVTWTNIPNIKNEFNYNSSILTTIYESENSSVELTFDYNAFEETKILRGVGFESEEVVNNIRICSGKEELKVNIIPKR